MTIKPQLLLAWVRDSRRLCAVFCLALFAAVHVLAACESLHQAVHMDAATHGHECVVTLLAQGGFAAPDTAFVLDAAHGTVMAQLEPSCAPSTVFDPSLAPTRGPPVG
ncbi:MAG TPA: hypothetical protein VEH04_16365 [Verrucomicrobiae bacterium]|nr:hypothetical protein [Verrucomicrobiae bacterium]